MTCLTYNGAEPLDIKPLTRLPKLFCATFTSQHTYGLDTAPPRDYMPLTDAPQLRELHVTGCPPVEAEVATLNAVLPPWDDLLLAEQPRPVPARPRLVVAPHLKHPRCADVALQPEDNGLPDAGLRACEGRWVARFIGRAITTKLDGHADWGHVDANGTNRAFMVWIESFGVVEKLPLILDGAREAIARLRHEYYGQFMICLKAPEIEPTPAQRELEAKFRAQCDEWEHENHQREQRERLERIYRYELKKQSGQKVDPNEFSAPAPGENYPIPPEESEDEDADDEDINSSGDIAVKKKPDPPPSFFDDEHPLADNYRMMGHIGLNEIWVISYAQQVFAYLMGRGPDEIIPEEKKSE